MVTPAKKHVAPKITELPPVFDLKWLDPSLSEAEVAGQIAEFERCRRFAHFGAAVAWARRQIFHGKVMGEGIELTPVQRLLRDGQLEEERYDPVEITLAGFSKWSNSETYGMRGSTLCLAPPKRKCRIMDD